MKKLNRFVFLIVCVGMFYACKPMSSTILQNESCLPPCWNGIIPGQTSLQEVNAKLKTISAVNVSSIQTRSMLQSNDSIEFKFFSYIRENEGRIYSQGGVVQAISFSPKQGSLLLSETLQAWGVPDQYISIYYAFVETPYLATNIIYTKQGIILDNIKDMRAEEIPKFDNNFPIQTVWFINPTLTTRLLQNGLIDNLNNQYLHDGLKPWTGFGEIRYLEATFDGIR